MVSSEKEYPADKRGRIFRFVLVAGILGVTLFQREILEALGRQPHFSPGLSFLLGCFFATRVYYFVDSLFRAKMRICDHYLIDNYDQNIVRWSQIKNVAVEGNSLTLHMSETRVWKGYSISLSSVPDKEEFMKEIKRICEIRGILFKEQQ